MLIRIAVCVFVLMCDLYCSTSLEVFKKCKNKYFVESGSYTGGGINMAGHAGFEIIHSVELAFHHYQDCCRLFSCYPNIYLYHGNSADVFPSILEKIDAPATFWLDGHYSAGTTAKGPSNTPILAELESIKRHPIKTHTILIDDIRQCGTIDFDFVTLSDLVSILFEINPDYRISFEDGYCPNDVLVAKIP